jgi:pimeloyl-ACP methyl ester carboxylesterase
MSPSSSPLASRIAGAIWWLLVAVVAVALLLPIAIAPFTTAVPVWLGLLLLVGAAALAVLALRSRFSPVVRGLLLMGGLLIASALAVGLSQALASTPPIVDENGRPLPGSIAVMEQVELNGSRQWITIRGKDANNPVLLFLAGGPGGSELPSTRLHLGELEDHFIVVNWDQPGAAKSYGAVPMSEMTPERYVQDGLALVEHLRQRFGEEKITLIGESWGTILGTWLVRDHPNLFSAWVSSGQMVNTTEDDMLGYRMALEVLEEQGDVARVAQLKQNGPPPYTQGNLSMTYAAYLGVLNDWMNSRAHGEGKDADILRDAIRAPEYGLLDKVNWLRGLMNTFNAVYPQLADVEFKDQAARLEVPAYFLVGRYDVNAMAHLVERYYEVLEAPHKELIWFEKSGHPPLYSEASKVVDILVDRVLQGQD